MGFRLQVAGDELCRSLFQTSQVWSNDKRGVKRKRGVKELKEQRKGVKEQREQVKEKRKGVKEQREQRKGVKEQRERVKDEFRKAKY